MVPSVSRQALETPGQQPNNLVAFARMIQLSVNVNKVATVRNSRTSQPGSPQGRPRVRRAVDVIIAAGAPGITVHPRADERHITAADVQDLAEALKPRRDEVEFNIEGDPRPDLVDTVLDVAPHQFTLVPVREGEITSQAGWPATTALGPLRQLIERVQAVGTRISMFVDPELDAIHWARDVGADRIELFTEPFAMAWAQDRDQGRRVFETYVQAAEAAHEAGLGINAGHDLDLDNLVMFRELPHLDEVSIGHALIADALFDGLSVVVKRYLRVLAGEAI